MLRRVHADNYRSLVNFEWRPKAETLVLGVNGSGKTSVLEAITSLRDWAMGQEPSREAFESSRLTSWNGSRRMTLGCDIEAKGALFEYHVELDFVSRSGSAVVLSETLSRDGTMIVRRGEQTVRFVTGDPEVDHEYPLPQGQSAIESVHLLRMSKAVDTFASALSSLLIVRPVPATMSDVALHPSDRPLPHFENFVGWYWAQTQNGAFARAMLGRLEEVWAEFDYLKLDPVGRGSAILGAVFKSPQGSKLEFMTDFRDLSDGERMLVVLYSLAAYQQAHPETTLIIDEPDNFVGLPELQPWLLRLLDERPDEGQVILVSHNDRIIDTMGYASAALFTRADHLSPTRVTGIAPDATGLALSERLSRGWIGE